VGLGLPRLGTHKKGFPFFGFVIQGPRRETADGSRRFLVE
jgi:hypothetical protein